MPRELIWLTNGPKNLDVAGFHCEIRIGDPKPTDTSTIEDLQLRNVVGFYRVESIEKDDTFVSRPSPFDGRGFWGHYKDNSGGRIINHVYHICGLFVAENITINGDNTLSHWGEHFATINWDKGFPYFNFTNNSYNKRQDELLNVNESIDEPDGIEIRGIPVTFHELAEDIKAAKQKGFSGEFAFTPETVEALLEFIMQKRNKFLYSKETIYHAATVDPSSFDDSYNDFKILQKFARYCLEYFHNDINFA